MFFVFYLMALHHFLLLRNHGYVIATPTKHMWVDENATSPEDRCRCCMTSGHSFLLVSWWGRNGKTWQWYSDSCCWKKQIEVLLLLVACSLQVPESTMK